MRFDDRLTTLLAAEPRDAAERASRWAQLADVYAQAGDAVDAETGKQIVERLESWRDDVSLIRRSSVAAAIATQRLPSALVELFALDAPQVAAPMLLRVHLPGASWRLLIHAIPPASRNLLRQRRDLPLEAERTLGLYAQADLALTHDGTVSAAEEQPIQISDLVARIEAYRRDHPVVLARTADAQSATHFRFETGADGAIVWVDGVQRGALIGLDLAEAVGTGVAARIGADAAFDGERLFVAGNSDAGGWWEVSGRAIGAGQGFRCVARRLPEETQSSLLAGALAPDSVRQLAHELRTPLNAIRGFSEMISGQFLGPVAGVYRERASAIADDAARLASVIDDLDLAAKIDSGAFAASAGQRCDAGQVLRRVAQQLRGVADSHGLTIQLSVPSALPDAALPEDEAARLMGRFLAALAGAAAAGSTIPVALSAHHGSLELSVGKPAPLGGLSEADLRRSVIGADAKDGPPLGFGFSFRLAEAHAQACGGTLVVCEEHFALLLPVVADIQRDAAANS